MVFLLLLLVSAAVLSQAFDNLCPSLEDLHPCYCVSDGKTIRVDCMGVSSVDDLRRGLRSVQNIRRVFIDFIRARFPRVPSDLFQGLHVTKLSFTNCDFEEFGDKGRSSLEGLENSIEELSIHFSFSEEKGLKYLNVSRMSALQSLEIEGNSITRLDDDWFRDGPSGLQDFFIMTNFIEELGDNAFASLSNLRNLWLTGNKFKVLKRSMFPSPARHLTSLDLSDNGIISLPGDLFSNMPSLREVVLAQNTIQNVPEATWSHVWTQLTRVYLEDNPLACDSGIEWMFDLRRPFVLKGKCVSPDENKGRDLKRIIDDKQAEDIDD